MTNTMGWRPCNNWAECQNQVWGHDDLCQYHQDELLVKEKAREHHYVVTYNTYTGKWQTVEENAFFPDGVIWDYAENSFRDSLPADHDGAIYSVLLDLLASAPSVEFEN